MNCYKCDGKFPSDYKTGALLQLCPAHFKEQMKPQTKAEPIHDYETGAKRSVTKGKGRFDLLPPYALREVARVYEMGAEQKGARNWERGVPLSRFIDSALRHTFQALDGQNDEPHAAQAIWNLLGYLETKHRIEEGRLPKELNDLPQ